MHSEFGEVLSESLLFFWSSVKKSCEIEQNNYKTLAFILLLKLCFNWFWLTKIAYFENQK